MEISNYLNSKYEVNKEILNQNHIFKPKMKIISKKRKRKKIVIMYFFGVILIIFIIQGIKC